MTAILTEITVGAGGAPQAVCDLDGPQARALSDALAHRRHLRFGLAALEADDLDALRALTALADELDGLRDGRADRLLVALDSARAQLACEAAADYLIERDVEGYQDPAERERLAVLGVLSAELAEVCFCLVEAQRELRARQAASL